MSDQHDERETDEDDRDEPRDATERAHEALRRELRPKGPPDDVREADEWGKDVPERGHGDDSG